jgi:hypothetical protein
VVLPSCEVSAKRHSAAPFFDPLAPQCASEVNGEARNAEGVSDADDVARTTVRSYPTCEIPGIHVLSPVWLNIHVPVALPVKSKAQRAAVAGFSC